MREVRKVRWAIATLLLPIRILLTLKKFTGQIGTIELPENLLSDDLDKEEEENDNAGSSVIEKQECKNGAVLDLLRKFTVQTGTIELPENSLQNDLDKDEEDHDNAGSTVTEKQVSRNGENFVLSSSSSSR